MSQTYINLSKIFSGSLIAHVTVAHLCTLYLNYRHFEGFRCHIFHIHMCIYVFTHRDKIKKTVHINKTNKESYKLNNLSSNLNQARQLTMSYFFQLSKEDEYPQPSILSQDKWDMRMAFH